MSWLRRNKHILQAAALVILMIAGLCIEIFLK
jgi:hypothetical protein